MPTIKGVYSICCLAVVCVLCACSTGRVISTPTYSLTVQPVGGGTITSTPAGISCGQTCSAKFPAGASVTITATAASGAAFTGWGGACSGTGSCTVTIAGDTTVSANFGTTNIPPVQLTVTNSGTGAGTVTSNPSGINCGQTCSANFPTGSSVTLTATAASGSTFAGWSGACSGTGACTVRMSAAASVTATFNASTVPPVQLTVQDSGAGAGTIVSNPAGINCGSVCSASFPSGTAVTLTPTAASGSTFTGWSGACSGTGACTVTMSSAASVTATFATATVPPVQLTVQASGTGTGTIISNPAGINCGSVCSANFPTGTSVTLTATPASGSTFAGWSGACSGTSACTVAMSAAASVTATFNTATSAQVQLTVQDAGTGSGTVTSNPAAITCGTTCSASFASGTSVVLTATPASGSAFAGWSGACAGTTSSCTLALRANSTVTATFTSAPPPAYQLTVNASGSGSGTVTSSPAGINCGSNCSAKFNSGAAVTLTAAAATGSSFAGWTGACTGTGTCSVDVDADTTIGAVFNTNGNPTGIGVINHIVLITQENRSLDNYLGALRQYWRDNGYADISFDGLPQFNPVSGEAPLQGPAPSNPGCDPANPPTGSCGFDTANLITSFHLNTMCTENTSPSWNEAHVDYNYYDQVGKYPPAKNNGFVHTAAGDARALGYNDVNGIRAMGYYNGGDLNFLYFMASNFGTSDRWFHPVMSRTNINREYMIAATSQGYVYPNGTTQGVDSAQLTAKTIYQALTDAGVSWKIYVNPTGSNCTAPYQASCLMKLSYLQNFTYAQTVLAQYPQNIGTITDYYNDLQNGTLPQVAVLEPASDAGDDEHGSDTDKPGFATNVQRGEQYAEQLINAVMATSGTANDAWKSTAIFMTYDESGGLYDHVAPQPTVSPDGIKPKDMLPGDVCNNGYDGPICDFTYTGYRIPLVVISPYAKKHYVSHTVADYTAMLKFIETRFNLAPLTKRDAAQMDMTEFFDFNNPAWMTPPAPPAQNMSGLCDLTKLQ